MQMQKHAQGIGVKNDPVVKNTVPLINAIAIHWDQLEWLKGKKR